MESQSETPLIKTKKYFKYIREFVSEIKGAEPGSFSGLMLIVVIPFLLFDIVCLPYVLWYNNIRKSK